MTFNIKTKIEQVSGWQFWTIEAESVEEAKRKFYAGDAKFEDEEIEVTDCGEPEIEEA